jgi:sugar lactone lactonase YvrE
LDQPGPSSVRRVDVNRVADYPAIAQPAVPAYVALAESGELLIGDRSHSAVLRFDPAGHMLPPLSPAGAAVAGVATRTGEVLVLDPQADRVVRLDLAGRVVGAFDFAAYTPYGPGALAATADGSVFIADTGRNRVLVFTSDGTLVRILESAGAEAAQLRQPMGLAVAADGSLYAADFENRRIVSWDAASNASGAWSLPFAPRGVAIDGSSRVYVADVDAGRVHVFTTDGQPLGSIDTTLPSGPNLDFPSQVAVTPDGSTVWVVGHNGLLRLSLQWSVATQRQWRPDVSLPIVLAGVALAFILGLAAAGRRIAIAAGKWLALENKTAPSMLACALWSVAVALAFVGQFVFLGRASPDEARPWHLAALAVALGAGLVSGTSLPLAQTLGSGGVTRPQPRSLLALLFGVALILVSVGLTAARLYEPATATWLTGIGVLIVGAAAAPMERALLPRLTRDRMLLLTVVTLGVVALALRTIRLVDLPPEVHGDEAAIGIAARKLLSGEERNLFGLGWYEIPNVSFAMSAVIMRLLGDDLFGLRMASALQGTLTVILTYLLARRLFGARAALVAAALLAAAEMHLHYSRTGYSYMQAGLATVLVLYLMLRALDYRRLIDYVLFGLAGGLCLQVYAAARLAPVLVVLYIGALALRERRLARAHLLGLAIAGGVGVLFVAPMAVTYAPRPSAFNLRQNEISILQPAGFQHQSGTYHVSTLGDVLRIQTQKTLEAFNYTGETSLQYGHPAPLLDVLTGALFVAGVGAFAFRLTHPAYVLVNAWLWLTLLLGSVLTVDAPFSPHLVGMLPVLALYPALFIESGWRSAEALFGRIGRSVGGAAIAGFIVAAAFANVNDYVNVHAAKLQPAGFSRVLSTFVSSVNDRYRVYLISRRDTSLDYETTKFLIPNVDGETLGDAPFVPPAPPRDKGMAFLVEAAMPDLPDRMAQLRATYPNGTEATHSTTTGLVLFTSYLVDLPAGR